MARESSDRLARSGRRLNRQPPLLAGQGRAGSRCAGAGSRGQVENLLFYSPRNPDHMPGAV
jgi:hypothetical protein